MNWIQYIIVILLVLIIAFILSEIKTHILIHKEKKNDFIEIHLWLFYNLVHIKRKIPMLAIESTSEGVKYETDTVVGKKDSKKKKRVTPSEAKGLSMNFKTLLNNVSDFYGVIKSFLQHVYIEKYRWETKIGLGDPMETGVIIGVAWSLKGTVIGLISKFVRIKDKPYLKINPDFDRPLFQTHLEFMVRFKVWHFLITGIRILFKYLKGIRKKTHKNILSKA